MLRLSDTFATGWIACAIVATAFAAAPPDKVARVGAKIIPVVGETLDKGTILIERGRITAIGKDVESPYDARVFDLTGKVKGSRIQCINRRGQTVFAGSEIDDTGDRNIPRISHR